MRDEEAETGLPVREEVPERERAEPEGPGGSVEAAPGGVEREGQAGEGEPTGEEEAPSPREVDAAPQGATPRAAEPARG